MLEPLDIQALRDNVAAGHPHDYLFFWGHQGPGKACLSQWFPASFRVEDHEYPTAEHFMMAEKARLFDDQEHCARILRAGTPAEAKALGREVVGFDGARWQEARFDIVVRGNRAKFGQNPQLADFLRATGSQVLVEASPTDAIWGIAMAAEDPRAGDPHQWLGLNLLGFALMSVRRELALGLPLG